MLKYVAENSFIYQWSPQNFLHSSRFERKSAGKSEMVTFLGFCNDCDTKIFSEIENNTPNFSLYPHRLLTSYRTILSELRKLEWISDSHRKIFDRNNNFSHSVINKHLPHAAEIMRRLIHLRYYKGLVEKEINGSEDSAFSSFHITLPKFALAASGYVAYGVIMPSDKTSINYKSYEQLQYISQVPDSFEPAFRCLVINIIPQENSMELVMFWDKQLPPSNKFPHDAFDIMSVEEVLHLVNNLLILGLENWVISPELYHKIQRSGNETKIIDTKNELVGLYTRASVEKISAPEEYINYTLRSFNLFEMFMS